MTHGRFPAPGEVLAGRYEVAEEIGRGAWSVVYAARDRLLGADVAVKLLVPPPAVAEVARERMRREVAAARGVDHLHVVRVFDFAEDGGWSFVVMERVPGPDLHQRVLRDGPLTPDEAAAVGVGVAGALAAAHRHGVLHRDVKPQNVLLHPDGRARLADFGSARLDDASHLTQTATLVGTVAYTAPEVFAGERADARADLFALGMTLYFALAGRLPDSRSPHLPPSPAPDGWRPGERRPGVPAWLDGVVARLTAADPRHRFPTAEAVLRALAGGSAHPSPLPVSTLSGECPLCGAPEAPGAAVCLACGGGGRADTLVLARFPDAPGAREQARAAVARVTGTPAIDARREARGEVPLAKLPAGAAIRLAAALTREGVQARTLPARRAASALPVPFVLLAGAVLAGGTLAGEAAALPLLSWSAPAISLLLLFGGYREVSTPLVPPRRTPGALPPETARAVADALGELPDGSARRLLADVAGVGRSLFEALRRDGDPFGVGARVSELLIAACATARGLDQLDRALGEMEARHAGRTELRTRWLDAASRAEAARDARAQHLLDALAVLGLLRSEAMEGRPDAAQIAGITRELESDVDAQAEARRDLDVLLAPAVA